MVRERQAHCCADPHLDMPFSLHSKCASASTWREEVETRNSNACGTTILPSWNSRRDEPCALVYVRVGDRANHLSTLQAPQPRSLSSLVPPAGLHEPASGIGACISVCVSVTAWCNSPVSAGGHCVLWLQVRLLATNVSRFCSSYCALL